MTLVDLVPGGQTFRPPPFLSNDTLLKACPWRKGVEQEVRTACRLVLALRVLRGEPAGVQAGCMTDLAEGYGAGGQTRIYPHPREHPFLLSINLQIRNKEVGLLLVAQPQVRGISCKLDAQMGLTSLEGFLSTPSLERKAWEEGRQGQVQCGLRFLFWNQAQNHRAFSKTNDRM